jgi:hypothetical protein
MGAELRVEVSLSPKGSEISLPPKDEFGSLQNSEPFSDRTKKMSQFHIQPSESPFYADGRKATRSRRNRPSRQPFLSVTEPQKLQLESSLYACAGGVSALLAGVVLIEENQTVFHVAAFGVFSTLFVICCIGVVACFTALNAWEDTVTRVTRHLKVSADYWRDEYERSASRGADAGKAGSGTRAFEPLPADVIEFPVSHWRPR